MHLRHHTEYVKKHEKCEISRVLFSSHYEERKICVIIRLTQGPVDGRSMVWPFNLSHGHPKKESQDPSSFLKDPAWKNLLLHDFVPYQELSGPLLSYFQINQASNN